MNLAITEAFGCDPRALFDLSLLLALYAMVKQWLNTNTKITVKSHYHPSPFPNINSTFNKFTIVITITTMNEHCTLPDTQVLIS